MIVVQRSQHRLVPDWSGVVEACGGNALHLPAVHRTEHPDDDIECVEFIDGTNRVGCALVLRVAQKRWKGLLGAEKTWVLPTAPAVVDPTREREVRDALFREARRANATRLVLLPGYSQSISADADLESCREQSITEFVLDLSHGVDAAHAAMHKNHRKNIRRASRGGVTVVEDSSLEGLLQLRELQLSSSQRAGERFEEFGVPDEAYFRRVHQEVYSPGLGSLLLARHDDETIAALAWLQLGAKAQTVRSGSLPAGYRSYAMYLLYSEVISRLVSRGCVELNAGGVPSDAAESGHAQSGLYEFKQGFGGRPELRYRLNISLEEVPGPEVAQ